MIIKNIVVAFSSLAIDEISKKGAFGGLNIFTWDSMKNNKCKKIQMLAYELYTVS